MTLTQANVITLSEIVRAAHAGAKVRWLTDKNGTILDGTARHIVHSAESPGFPNEDEDIRDCVLRITSTSGYEYFVPVPECVRLRQSGAFAIDDPNFT